MKTLYISDLDGTLLDSNAELSEYTVKTLNRLIAGGTDFTVATSRNIPSAIKILERLDLRLPTILCNGVIICDPKTREIKDVKYIPPDAVAAVHSAIRRRSLNAQLYALDGAEQTVYYEPGIETASMKDYRETLAKRYGRIFTLTDDLDRMPAGVVFRIGLHDVHSRLAPLYEELRQFDGVSGEFYRNTYTENEWLLEIFSAEASKGNAALELKKLGGFDRLVGFGDNLNDLSLFAVCDERCAVANAAEEVMSASDSVIGANTDNGVARWLEEREKGNRE